MAGAISLGFRMAVIAATIASIIKNLVKRVLDDYYQEMYDFLEKHLNMEARKTLEEVKAEILKQPFDIPIIFDKLVDQVIHLIQITKNQPIERLEAE